MLQTVVTIERRFGAISNLFFQNGIKTSIDCAPTEEKRALSPLSLRTIHFSRACLGWWGKGKRGMPVSTHTAMLVNCEVGLALSQSSPIQFHPKGKYQQQQLVKQCSSGSGGCSATD